MSLLPRDAYGTIRADHAGVDECYHENVSATRYVGLPRTEVYARAAAVRTTSAPAPRGRSPGGRTSERRTAGNTAARRATAGRINVMSGHELDG